MASVLDVEAVRGRWGSLLERLEWYRCGKCGDAIKPKGCAGQPPKLCKPCRREADNALRRTGRKRGKVRTLTCGRCGARHYRRGEKLCRSCACEGARCDDCGKAIEARGDRGRLPRYCDDCRRRRKIRATVRWERRQRCAA